MTKSVSTSAWILGLLALAVAPGQAADLVALSPQTWDRYAPQGKEVDAIYGDFALANGTDHRGGRPPEARAETRT